LLLSGLGDNAAAQGALRRALELRPTHVGARYQLGLALVAANDLPGAVQAWTEVLRREPGHTSTRERLAEYHLSKRDYAAAERTLRDGLRLRPGALGLQNTLAWLLATSPESTQRRGAEAVTLAEKAVAATRRTDATTLDTLAAAYAEVGRFDDARQAIAEAIRLLMNARVPADQAQPIVETVQRYKARQQLYWANKPYHEE
jgi:tetratricopeptide (TPR) repeat protein